MFWLDLKTAFQDMNAYGENIIFSLERKIISYSWRACCRTAYVLMNNINRNMNIAKASPLQSPRAIEIKKKIPCGTFSTKTNFCSGCLRRQLSINFLISMERVKNSHKSNINGGLWLFTWNYMALVQFKEAEQRCRICEKKNKIITTATNATTTHTHNTHK